MDADDESNMAYFLPNGIADDSPPKQSRLKASFGPIGGRSVAATTNQSTTGSPGNGGAVSAASADSTSRSDVDFSGLHPRPRPTLEPSPFDSASTPRPTNYLLSDLGGEIHTPRASRDLGDSGRPTPSSSSPFGFAGPFGSGLSDTGAIGGAGAIRSPSSMFNRGQEAKSFSMQGEGRRNLAGSYGGSEAQQLYRGDAMSSFLSAGDTDNPFGSSSMRTWPSAATNVSQPRRMLQRPPGLAGPPGLTEPSTMDGMQTHMHLGAGGGDVIQQRVAGSQFGPFHPSTSSPMAAEGATNGAFSGGDDQYGSSLLSSLRLSTDVFGDSALCEQIGGRGVSNPELAELNTHSVEVNEMGDMRVRQAVDSSSTRWDTREPTTSRRIDIQARSKMPRSPKKARDGRRKSEGRSDLRARALEFSMDTINAFAPESPMKPKRSERGRKVTSAIAHDGSNSSYKINRCSNDQVRGKRRNPVADTGATSSSLNTVGIELRREELKNDSEDSGSVLTHLVGVESSGNAMTIASRESDKSKRRDDTKPLSRSTARRNFARGNDKGAGTTRRQVYREKQVKETVKELLLLEETTTPIVASPSTKSNSPHGNQVSSDSQKAAVKRDERKKNVVEEVQSDVSYSNMSKVFGVPSYIKASADDIDEAVETTTKKASGSHVAVANDRADHAKKAASEEAESSPPLSGTSQNIPTEEPATSTERESFSSSDAPEYEETAREEPNEASKTYSPELNDILSHVESSESDADRAQKTTNQQRAASTKKSKKKVSAAVVPSTDSSPNTEVGPSVPPVSLQVGVIEKKHPAKEHRKDKSKKDKVEKKKTSRGKKEKRGASLVSKAADVLNDSTTDAQDQLLEALATTSTSLSTRISQGLRKAGSAAASAGLLAFLGTRRGCVWVAGRLNVKGLLATTFSYVESVLAVVFSVVLLLSLHAASWFIRVHRVAFRAILTHRHIGFCFAFLYGFPFLVQYVFPWAPPWAPVCLWYAFLVQLFCTNGPTAMVTTFRVILPLVFLVEGISHHSFLLDLNGAELLLTSFIISALKTSNLCSPIFFLSLATQCLLAVFVGSELLVQWLQLALALYSLHVMAATDDELIEMGDEEDELTCHPVSMHHAIADYNHHPAPSSAVSIQKTKRLDRRALAYVRGRRVR